MALTVTSQINFFAGAHVGMEFVPDGSRRYHYLAGAEDIVNGLLNDDGAIFRRGGCTTALASYSGAPHLYAMLWTGQTAGGLVGVAFDTTYAASAAHLHSSAIAAGAWTGDVTYEFTGVTGQPFPKPLQAVGIEGGVVLSTGAPGTNWVIFYGGTRTPVALSSVAVTATAGDRKITLVSTAGLAAGQSLRVSGQSRPAGIIATVDSSTQISLVDEWRGATGGTTVDFVSYITTTWPDLQPQMTSAPISAIGNGAGRLYVAQNERIFFSLRHRYGSYLTDDYHTLPLGSRVLGLQGAGDSVFVFSTNGVWMIGNAELALTDAAGNPQQSLQQIDPEFVLWDHHGLAAWENRLIAPGTQDVVMLTPSGQMQSITGGIAKLYRGYVKAGYQLGSATVFHGHYLLPIINATTVIDVLVCRLDSEAWSRWAGQAAGQAFATAISDLQSTDPPALYAINGASILNCTGCFDETTSSPADADGSQHALTLVGRTRKLDATGRHTWRNVRIPYDITGTGSFTLETAVGAPGSAFRAEAGAPVAPAQDTAKVWWFARQGKSFRYRVTSTGAPSSLVIRGDEVGVRPHQQV